MATKELIAKIVAFIEEIIAAYEKIAASIVVGQPGYMDPSTYPQR